MGIAARTATDAVLSGAQLEYASRGKGGVCLSIDQNVPVEAPAHAIDADVTPRTSRHAVERNRGSNRYLFC
jgi:hypothetical protein